MYEKTKKMFVCHLPRRIIIKTFGFTSSCAKSRHITVLWRIDGTLSVTTTGAVAKSSMDCAEIEPVTYRDGGTVCAADEETQRKHVFRG